MSATKRAVVRKSPKSGTGPVKRRMSAEEREIAELMGSIDRKLDQIEKQNEAILRNLESRRGA
jgi:hypothetical protein